MPRLLSFLLILITLPALAQKPVWIDVRSPAEFNTGHLAGAHHIPFDQIETGIMSLDVSKDSEIYVYCAVGGRAEVARENLERRGYTRVVNVGSLENARTFSGQLQLCAKSSDAPGCSTQGTPQETNPAASAPREG